MSTVPKLSDILQAMEMQLDETHAYLDRSTGEIVVVTDDDLAAAEDDVDMEDYPAWEQEAIESARKILAADETELVPLPSKFDIREYSIMESFCRSIENPGISDALFRAINGKGAFRRFNIGIRKFDVENKWYKYRDEAFKTIAIEWCEENDIPYTDD